MPEPRWDLVVDHLPMAESRAARFARHRPGDFDGFYDAALDALIAASAGYREDSGGFERLASVAIRRRILTRIRLNRCECRNGGIPPLRLGLEAGPGSGTTLDVAAPPGPPEPIEDMVECLPDRQARTILLRFRDGMRRGEIVREMGHHYQMVTRDTAAGLARLAVELAGGGR